MHALFPSSSTALTCLLNHRTVVDRAVAISKQFEQSSRKRERAQCDDELLPLTLQADAAFLAKIAQLGLDYIAPTPAQKLQVLNTMKIIAEGFRRAREIGTVE